ncbi:head closure Hc1 [Gordonia phage Yvonnetastic]|uniref:Head-to-tail stopper n=1 Tax=Gordonia phage Yvonnetastic TaxID=1821566 RepID=A0A142K8Z6_9CAUD|nr:head closure Hc1 [Gordonia phage Yvonnetastic]AMS02579.1 hypothetical protein SEA_YVONNETASTIC_35 [Gordonia phage Yvonnetastic]WKW86012.1 hypothetical protein SEA_JONJAMES_37 [Gordonia Phage JonJames]
MPSDFMVIHRPSTDRTTRQKHGNAGKSRRSLEPSHEVPCIISYTDTDSFDDPEYQRDGRTVDAKAWYDAPEDVMASDLIELPDGLLYRIIGKPLPRKSGLTGRVMRTLVELTRTEG